MLRRVFMAILIACLAVPAVAMPIAQEADTTMAKGHCDDPERAPADDGNATAPHGCIGCLAPFSARLVPVAPVSVRGPVRHPVLVTQHPHSSGAPEPPPPRH
jgi:hypothetical protein